MLADGFEQLGLGLGLLVKGKVYNKLQLLSGAMCDRRECDRGESVLRLAASESEVAGEGGTYRGSAAALKNCSTSDTYAKLTTRYILANTYNNYLLPNSYSGLRKKVPGCNGFELGEQDTGGAINGLR